MADLAAAPISPASWVIQQPMTGYERTQHAKALPALLICTAVAPVLLSLIVPAPPTILALISTILVACGYVFSSLTIRVNDRMLNWSFGPGVFRKEVPLTEIMNAEVTRTRWFDGWGIHLTGRGWLYNVAGFGAVLVTRENGKTFLLGTDEPERLRLAILEGARSARQEGRQ